MALINCPECGKEISDKAIHCLQCGYPISNTSIATSTANLQSKDKPPIKKTEKKSSKSKKFPNGFGGVVNLGSGRRKPYAVRKNTGYKKNKNGNAIPMYEYLAYFEKEIDAISFLVNYNSNKPINEYSNLIQAPTFKKLFDEWYEYRLSRKKAPSKASIRGYKYGFNMCAPLHNKKIDEITFQELQELVDEYNTMSKSVVGSIRTILFAVFKQALKHKYIEQDPSQLVDYEWTEERFIEHTTFKNEEIEKLWNNVGVEMVDWVLIMIYMGWRVSEFCEIETANINLEEKYIIGGKKTEAGRERIVPIHSKILPLIEKMYNKENELLVLNKFGKPVIYKTFRENWNVLMDTFEMSHTPHDTRYTTASLLDTFGANKVCIKKILGHAISDITDGVYIQKELSELSQAIEVIKI